MKSFTQYLIEANEAYQKFNKYGSLKIERGILFLDGEKVGKAFISIKEILSLSIIMIDKEHRKSGYGNQFMEQLVKMADDLSLTIGLTPSNSFGASKAKLVKWYKKFDFKKNTGGKADFTISDTMIRRPQ